MFAFNSLTIGNESRIKKYPKIQDVFKHKKWMKNALFLSEDYDNIKVNWNNQVLILRFPKINFDYQDDIFKIREHKMWIEKYLNNQIIDYEDVYCYNDDDAEESVNFPLLK